MSSNSGTQDQTSQLSSSPEIDLQTDSTKPTDPIIIHEACFDFVPYQKYRGYDVITDIVVFNRNHNTKPTSISNDFCHSITWNGDYGVVDLSNQWINVKHLKTEKDIFNSHNDSIMIFCLCMNLSGDERRRVAQIPYLMIDPIGIVMYPKTFLNKNEEDFNCLRIGPDTEELRLELNGHPSIKFTRCGLKAYRQLGRDFFRLTSHHRTQFTYPGVFERGRQSISTIKLYETKCISSVESY